MSESTDLQRAVESLTQTIEKLRDELVRKDVYQTNERARDQQMADTREDLRDAKAIAAADVARLEKKVDDHYAKAEADRVEQTRERRADRRVVLGAAAASAFSLLSLIYTRAQGIN